MSRRPTTVDVSVSPLPDESTPSRARGVWALLMAAFMLWLATRVLSAMPDMSTVQDYSREYIRGTAAHRLSIASFGILFASLSAWFGARSLRNVLLLPRPRRAGWQSIATWIRMVVAGYALFRMVGWVVLDGGTLRFMGKTPGSAMGSVLLVWLVFAYDVPWLVGYSIRFFRLRWPVMMRLTAWESLPNSGVVRLRGIVAEGARPLGEELTSFTLTGQGRRVWIECDPRHTTVLEIDGAAQAAVALGDEVDVVGEIEGAEQDAYRGAEPRMGAGQGQLYIVPNPAIGRRLVVAATAELVGALGFVACGVWLVVIWAMT